MHTLMLAYVLHLSCSAQESSAGSYKLSTVVLHLCAFHLYVLEQRQGLISGILGDNSDALLLDCPHVVEIDYFQHQAMLDHIKHSSTKFIINHKEISQKYQGSCLLDVQSGQPTCMTVNMAKERLWMQMRGICDVKPIK